jgi:hypothetical protein
VVGVGAAFLVLSPGAFFLTAGVGFLGGFAFDAAAQYDATDGWADFDWQRTTTAGVIGAVTSVIIAAGGAADIALVTDVGDAEGAHHIGVATDFAAEMEATAVADGSTEPRFRADYQLARVDWLTAVAPDFTSYRRALATAGAACDNAVAAACADLSGPGRCAGRVARPAPSVGTPTKKSVFGNCTGRRLL